MFSPESLIVWIVALPLSASILTAVLGPWLLGRWSHLPTNIALAGSLVLSLVLLSNVLSEPAPNTAAAVESGADATPGHYEKIVNLWTWAALDGAIDSTRPDPATLEPESRPADDATSPFKIEITLRIDGLTMMMLSMVTFISLFVSIYAIGYMHGDPGYWRFFAYLPLFVFSMTLLVAASNYLLLYASWEGVGVCSYLLIGFWYTKPSAAAAAKKAFLVNRIGDFGLALSLFFIWITFHTLNFHDVPGPGGQGIFSQLAAGVEGFTGSPLALTICLLMLVGACGKSAQFPLHIWLPDAMEGPTPVSALMHAATMVTAGVYLVARSTPLFVASPDAQLVVALIGGITAILAALIAITQFDLKRVLAYSTISQLGYMFMGLGAGTFAGISSGMFHLLTHAFFKALLFLGAGSVMHAMGDVLDMRRFGGLRRIMPITCATFLIAGLALSGLWPLAGFWSKDAILDSLHERVHTIESQLAHEGGEGVEAESTAEGGGDEHGAAGNAEAALALGPAAATRQMWGLWIVYWISVITAGLTAFYTFRAFFMTFFGELQVPAEAGHHAHESPPVMWWPQVVLATGVLVISGICQLARFIPAWQGGFSQLIGRSPWLDGMAATAVHGGVHWGVFFVSTGFVVFGIALAAYLYLENLRDVTFLQQLFDFRWMQPQMPARVTEWLARQPAPRAVGRVLGNVGLGWLAGFVRFLTLVALTIVLAPLWLGYIVSPYRLSKNKFYFDEIYDWCVVKPVRGFGRICATLDSLLLDGIVDFVGRVPGRIGSGLRNLQMGLLSFYALAMLLGVLALVVVKAWWP